MLKYLLSCFLLLTVISGYAQTVRGPVRVIAIDPSNVKGPLDNFFNLCVGAGRANEGLRADWQRQLLYVRQQAGFRYIRMHGLLSDDMGVYTIDATGRVRYNWQYIDELFDFFERAGIIPFVEFGFMPNALASGTHTIFWWKGNVTPPNSYEKWADLIRALVQHWTERYGHTTLKKWYFEVWNEPNLKDGFWTGDQAEYFKLYDFTARAVKSVSPAYRTGGPATAGNAWISEFIAFCKANQTPLDFISTHTYGVDQGFLDEKGNSGTVLSKREDAVNGDVWRVREQIRESGMPQLELHYTEWSASYTPSDPIHDSYHEAAYILEKLRKSAGAAQSMSYWTFTDIFEEAGPRYSAFHGGFGLLNYQDIVKPAFYAYKYLHLLGNKELNNQDSQSWVCKKENGDIQVLAWDFTRTLPDGKINNQQYYNQVLPSRNKGRILLQYTKLKPGKYRMTVNKTGYRQNDPYTNYLQMGSPDQLSRTQVAELKKQSDDAPVSDQIITVPGTGSYAISLPLRENDVVFIQLKKQ